MNPSSIRDCTLLGYAWLPAAEAMPRERTEVCVSYRNSTGAADVVLAYWNGSCWVNSRGGLTELHEVYAWMPLPQPAPLPKLLEGRGDRGNGESAGDGSRAVGSLGGEAAGASGECV